MKEQKPIEAKYRKNWRDEYERKMVSAFTTL